jgi:hypothetical protein
MKQPFKILLFKEWKESPNYKVDQWFAARKIEIEKWFETELPDFEIDYFEWDDTSSVSDIFTGCLYFGEPEINYKLNFILDYAVVKDGTIDKVNLQLDGYRKNDGETLGTIDTEITPEELNSNLIIELVDKFKTDNLDEQGNRKANNDLPGPESKEEDNTLPPDDNTSDTEEPVQPDSDVTGEVQEDTEAQPAQAQPAKPEDEEEDEEPAQ